MLVDEELTVTGFLRDQPKAELLSIVLDPVFGDSDEIRITRQNATYFVQSFFGDRNRCSFLKAVQHQECERPM